MSKRGREFARQLANRHMELYGVSKAYGSSLAENYLPFGEGLNAIEKAVSQAKKNARRQREASRALETMLAHAGEAMRREGQALDRLEAACKTTAAPEKRFQAFTMGSHPMEIPEANGYSFNGEN